MYPREESAPVHGSNDEDEKRGKEVDKAAHPKDGTSTQNPSIQKMAWNRPSETPASPLSLADIMAQEREDRLAAQAAYGDSHVALVQMEEEQQRLFQALQDNSVQVEQQTTFAVSEEDENILLEMIMRQSLAEYQGAVNERSEAEQRNDDSDRPDSAQKRTRASALLVSDDDFSVRTFQDIEKTGAVVDSPHQAAEERRMRIGRQGSQRSMASSSISSHPSSCSHLSNTSKSQTMSKATKHLSAREVLEIRQALREEDFHDAHPLSNLSSPFADNASCADKKYHPQTIESVAVLPRESFRDHSLSREEAAAIEAALMEADRKEEEESLRLALQMQEEELRNRSSGGGRQGNVRTMTREQLNFESQRVGQAYGSNSSAQLGAVHAFNPPPVHPLEREEQLSRSNRVDGLVSENSGFRMNSASAQQWSRLDRNTIIGPNCEVRTKHDVHVQGQGNAEYLGLEQDDFGVRAHVGNQAFNSFRNSMKRSHKGVAAHGTGRAGSDTGTIKGKAMDPQVRLHISRAINTGLIEKCNGVVKQGKEAVVYHAEKGPESEGFDVGVKVFKRISEFRNRGDYVDGDPRYLSTLYRKHSNREQLELWTEKEFRNLVRANRAKVPVPTPLQYKENVIFMRFMGTNCWPAPQIREIDMKTGSKRWGALYTQVMEAVRRLYVDAHLVHCDLSEYNILVVPVFQVDNPISVVDDATNDLQIVLIDFGQAVDVRHFRSDEFLRRDLERVRSFFVKRGVMTLSLDDSVALVTNAMTQPSDLALGGALPRG